MKNLRKILLVLIIFSAQQSFSQIIISPYIVYMDEQSKFGSMMVQNESMEPYEISISFVFGFPVSDSLGNRTMNYIEHPKEHMPSINNWIKAFPKKFVLAAKEKQTIRFMIRPPHDLPDGTYWTRIVTSSVPIDNSSDTIVTGVSAKLKFVLNQVTTAIYRKGNAVTGLKISTPKLYKDSSNSHQLLYPLERKGNSPFFGFANLKILSETNEIIMEDRAYLSIYFDLIRNYSLDKELFPKGKYTAELEIEFNEKADIPESRLKDIPTIKEKFEFMIP